MADAVHHLGERITLRHQFLYCLPRILLTLGIRASLSLLQFLTRIAQQADGFSPRLLQPGNLRCHCLDGVLHGLGHVLVHDVLRQLARQLAPALLGHPVSGEQLVEQPAHGLGLEGLRRLVQAAMRRPECLVIGADEVVREAPSA